MIATKKQIFQHYLDAGMPEVYAAMAAEEDCGRHILKTPIDTLLGSFIWDDSALGHDFWVAIVDELAYD